MATRSTIDPPTTTYQSTEPFKSNVKVNKTTVRENIRKKDKKPRRKIGAVMGLDSLAARPLFYLSLSGPLALPEADHQRVMRSRSTYGAGG